MALLPNPTCTCVLQCCCMFYTESGGQWRHPAVESAHSNERITCCHTIFVVIRDRERQFHMNESSWNVRSGGTKVPRERKFSLWTFRCRERKCRGTKSPTFHPSTFKTFFPRFHMRLAPTAVSLGWSDSDRR